MLLDLSDPRVPPSIVILDRHPSSGVRCLHTKETMSQGLKDVERIEDHVCAYIGDCLASHSINLTL